MNIADTARLLAMVSLAGADAEIGCINDKNYWNWWRPITAIREAKYDGNPDTTPDLTWTPRSRRQVSRSSYLDPLFGDDLPAPRPGVGLK